MLPLEESREGGGQLRNAQIFIGNAFQVMFRPFDRLKEIHLFAIGHDVHLKPAGVADG
jgi:hypothetical protein